MKKPIALAIAMALAPTLTLAQQQEHDSAFLVYLGGGLEYIEKDLGLEKRRQEYVELGLGYQSSPNWEFMLRKGYADSYFEDQSFDIHYTLDAEEEWQPMLKVGFGSASYGEDEFDYLGLGLGVKTMISDNWDFRAMLVRHFGDYSRQDDVFTMGFSYYFGKSSSTSVDMSNEPVVETNADDDNDGVTNDYDRCPNTPAGTTVDSLGCTLVEQKQVEKENPDKDGDGVLDINDSCLNTPANTEVDASGCAKVAVEVAQMTLKITFATNSSEISSTHKSQLKDLADLVAKYPNAIVEVEGHTDSMGSAKYNKWLSERRAQTVKQYLMTELSLPENKVNSTGYGEEQPIADNNTAEGRAENRRVVAKLVYR